MSNGPFAARRSSCPAYSLTWVSAVRDSDPEPLFDARVGLRTRSGAGPTASISTSPRNGMTRIDSSDGERSGLWHANHVLPCDRIKADASSMYRRLCFSLVFVACADD